MVAPARPTGPGTRRSAPRAATAPRCSRPCATPGQLGADADRVADVLERVGADGEVELVVGERPRLAVADVALHPGVGGEALVGPSPSWPYRPRVSYGIRSSTQSARRTATAQPPTSSTRAPSGRPRICRADASMRRAGLEPTRVAVAPIVDGTLLERAKGQTWYHTIDVGPGPDHQGLVRPARRTWRRYHLPDDMAGMRALDIGTWDGFWAFEMERRGAEVVALDVDHESEYDWPPRRRPARAQGARPRRGLPPGQGAPGLEGRAGASATSTTPRPRSSGTFDLVFCGAVLIHLRDQLLALERFAGLCRGQLIFAEEYDRPASLVPFPVSRYHADRDAAVVFWLPARKTWKRMIWTGGLRGRARARAASRSAIESRRRATTADPARGDPRPRQRREQCSATVREPPGGPAPARRRGTGWPTSSRRCPRASRPSPGRWTCPTGGRVLDYGCADPPYRHFFAGRRRLRDRRPARQPGRDARDRARRHGARRRRRASTPSCRPRCSSTSPTRRSTWPSATACCARAGGCCSPPTGSWSTTPTPIDYWRWTCAGLRARGRGRRLRGRALRGHHGPGRDGLQLVPGRALLAAAAAAAARASRS